MTDLGRKNEERIVKSDRKKNNHKTVQTPYRAGSETCFLGFWSLLKAAPLSRMNSTITDKVLRVITALLSL